MGWVIKAPTIQSERATSQQLGVENVSDACILHRTAGAEWLL